MYRYEVKIEIWDLETFKIIVHDRVTVDEDEIEGLKALTVEEEFRDRGENFPLTKYKNGQMEISKPTRSVN